MSGSMSRRGMLKSVGVGVATAALAGAGGASVFAQGRAVKSSLEYALPPLPYGYDDLEPGLEERVLHVHHDKHHAGYVKGLKATLAKLEAAREAGDFAAIKALSRDLAFTGSGHVLHDLYWKSMTPGESGEPKGELAAALARDFGSLAAFQAQFLAATKKVEGSGWGVLVYEPVGARLLVLQVEKHQNLTVWGCAPLLVCDVWEHAYYVQYQNRRGDYVDAFWQLIDWPGVAERLKAARG